MLLAAWGGAAVAGRVSLDDAACRASRDGEIHRVVGVPGEDREVTLPMALGRLRALGVHELHLALPAPGDPAGLPGPPAFNTAALEAGEAVLCGPSPAYGLVPTRTPLGSSGTAVRWQAQGIAAAPAPGTPSLAEAERMLQETMRQVTAELVRLDVARWRPEVADALRSLRDGGHDDTVLAPGAPARAVRVLATARRLAAIAALAGADAGAAVSAREITLRGGALAELSRASRRAMAAACNAVYEPTWTPGH